MWTWDIASPRWAATPATMFSKGAPNADFLIAEATTSRYWSPGRSATGDRGCGGTTTLGTSETPSVRVRVPHASTSPWITASLW